LSFLQPVWLWAIAGVALPIVIHLWNVKQGKVLQVGSISLLMQSDRQQAKSILLKDLILLLVRCLLIIILALLLAQPIFKKTVNDNTEKGWIVMEQGSLKNNYSHYKPQVDSLLKAGYTFHYFNKEAAETDFAEALSGDTIRQSTNPRNYWLLLQSLDQHVPDSLPVFLYTSNDLGHFKGTRPAVSMNLHWNMHPTAASKSSWLANAYADALAKTHIAIANSTTEGTSIVHQQYAIGELPSNMNAENKPGGSTLYLTDDDGNTSSIPIDTASIEIVLYSNTFAADISYVKAAIDAIRSVGQRRVNVSVVRNLSSLPGKIDWLFWLSYQPLPSIITYKNALVYSPGKQQTLSSWIQPTVAGNEPFTLFKTTETKANNKDEKIWTDGYGQSLLSLQHGSKNTYSFYSRFHPQWSDLVWSQHFPEVLFNLLYSTNSYQIHPLDKRVVEPSQLLPRLVPGNNTKEKFITQLSLNMLFWSIAFVLFCLERLLSFVRKKEGSYA